MKRIMEMTAAMTVGICLAVMVAGCGNSEDGWFPTKLGDHIFAGNSDELTNPFFPAKAGDVINFAGTSGDFIGDRYTWTFTAGPSVQGVKTLQEDCTYTVFGGTPAPAFASLLAQDVQGNVHILANRNEAGQWVPSGVAAGKAATLIMITLPATGDVFHPDESTSGSVISTNEVKPGYPGLLHTRMTTSGDAPDVYDDYWLIGVGQVLSEWTLGDGTGGTWTRLPD
ncbi:MAG: hypothetical protein JW943_10555 [Deltaproteobacteria bacterium]|nr:hypothetical protein [Deltaproteobacteria bacterium]